MSKEFVVRYSLIGGAPPMRASEYSAGIDLYSPSHYNVAIPPCEITVIDTGVVVEIPHGHYGKLELRSSIARKGFTIHGGVIDSDYRGSIKVMLSTIKNGLLLERNVRFAQLIIMPCVMADLVQVPLAELTATNRGTAGLGAYSGQ
jgi:dUTP pyrophosphatase